MIEVTLHEERRHDLPVLAIPAFRSLGIDAFLTTREGGVSAPPYDTLNLGQHVGDDPAAVSENRRRVALAAGVTPEQLLFTDQVHGAVVNDADQPGPFRGDALVSRRDDRALAIMTADCIPLLLADETAVAVVHAGWRGLAAGILPAAVSAFADPAAVHVFLGPAISPRIYQVGPDVAEVFAHIPDIMVPDESANDKRWLLDLHAIAATQLTSAGVHEEHLLRSVHHTDGGRLFFSDRAQRPCGRFALVARRATYDEMVEAEA